MFKNRVSPHFSTASELLFVLTKGKIIYFIAKIDFSSLSPEDRRRRLLTLGIDTLICDGIDKATKIWATQKGILVRENTTGEAWEAINSFLNEECDDDF